MALNAGFQYLEQRNTSDEVVKQGVVGKTTPFCNATNTGIYDIIAEDLRVLHELMVLNIIQSGDEFPDDIDTPMIFYRTDEELFYYFTGTEWIKFALDEDNYYTKDEVDTELDTKADKSTTYTKTQVDTALTTAITTAINNLVDGAPEALDTLKELAAALSDDSNFASTITAALGTKADKSTTYTKTQVDNALAEKADKSSAISNWVSGTIYSVNDIVVYDSKIYQCTTANDDAEFISEKWNNIGGGGGSLWIYDSSTHTIRPKTEEELAVEDTGMEEETVGGLINSIVDNKGYASTVNVNTALALKADKLTTYTKTEVDNALAGKADSTDLTAHNTDSTAHADKFAGYYNLQMATNTLQNIDLNDIKAVGVYTCLSNAISQTITNRPMDGAFKLVVNGRAITPDFIALQQTAIYTNNNFVYIRSFEGQTWSAWQKLATTDKLSMPDENNTIAVAKPTITVTKQNVLVYTTPCDGYFFIDIQVAGFYIRAGLFGTGTDKTGRFMVYVPSKKNSPIYLYCDNIPTKINSVYFVKAQSAT